MSIEQQIQFFCGTLIPAVKKKGVGQLIVTGNPIDKIDFLEWLEKNKAFSSHYYPAINKAGEPLAPEHYTVAEIEDKRNQMPAHIFEREYMLHRVSAADSRFKEEWITYYKPSDHDGIPLYKVMTIDPAINPSGDALAAVVTGTTPRGFTDVLDCMLFHGDLNTGIGRLVDMMVTHQPDFIGFESFAMQTMYKVLLEQEIKKRGLYFNITEIGHDSKKKKSARIESLQPILSQRRMRFLPEHKELINQFLLWDPLSKTNSDDGVDCLGWQVPLWRKPGDNTPVRKDGPDEGTFDEAMERILSRNADRTLMGRLFSDMGSVNA